MSKPALKLVITGHVDHGKSTLVGRLLHDAGALADGKLDAIKAAAARRGMAFEWGFVMDALQTERDQNLTIEAAQVCFSTPKRRITLIDAPGHREFLRNMITGAAHADAALLLVDAQEGLQEQTRRHAWLLHLLGITQVIVVVNKMDAVPEAEAAFARLSGDIISYMERIGIAPLHIIPAIARDGDNIARRSRRLKFYKGPTVLAALERLRTPSPRGRQKLRFPIQDVYKFDDRRILAGRIESGTLSIGDTLLFSPSGARAKVASFEAWPEGSAPHSAVAGQSVGITLEAPIFVERGQVASSPAHPPMLTAAFRARIFWLGAEPLTKEKRYRLRIGTAEVTAELREIESVIDTDTLRHGRGESVPPGGAAEVVFHTRGLVAVDAGARFVIIERHAIAGGGTIDLSGFTDQRVKSVAAKSQHLSAATEALTIEQRIRAGGHLPGILWFTGLSGSGKSTLAQALSQALFAKGCRVFVLDGDNIRKGLSRDLGFSARDRRENLRRAGEVAALFAQSGAIVITAFISPTAADRALARACAPEHFHSVYIKADLATCEGRDAKGLYKKARAGEIAEFTGISAPYEVPQHADLVVDTAAHGVEECLQQLLHYVDRQFIRPARAGA